MGFVAAVSAFASTPHFKRCFHSHVKHTIWCSRKICAVNETLTKWMNLSLSDLCGNVKRAKVVSFFAALWQLWLVPFSYTEKRPYEPQASTSDLLTLMKRILPNAIETSLNLWCFSLYLRSPLSTSVFCRFLIICSLFTFLNKPSSSFNYFE